MPRYCVNCSGELEESYYGYSCPHCRCGGAACEGESGRGLPAPLTDSGHPIPALRREEAE